MKFPEEEYCGLNRILLSAYGLWPYDSFKRRHIHFIMSLLIIISFPSIQWIKLYTSYSSDLLLKILSYNIIFIICSVKHITLYVIFKNIKELRERVLNNWDSLKDNQEIEIMCKYGYAGKLITIFLTMLAYLLCGVYIFTQYLTALLDIITPLNVSRPRELLFLAEYFIDQEKYFYVLSIYVAFGMIVSLTCLTATESFSLTNALHAFGLFQVASYRMQHILHGIHSHMCLTRKYTISQNKIIGAVDFHRRAIEYSELLRTSFTQSYLILLVLGVCSASINLFNLARILTIDREIPEMIKSFLSVIVHVLFLTVINYAGQEFMNCDTHFYRVICNTEWFSAPIKTQKLILFLIQKTTRCYKVDAGGMFSPCLEGLATSLSMTISYFIVLYSVSL